MTALIEHPQYKAAKQQYEQKVQELTGLLCRHDHMILQEAPALEAKYLKAVGDLQRDVYEQFVETARLKRSIQLAQIYINHGKEIDQNEIVKTLKKEFRDYEKKLSDMAEELDLAKRLECTVMDPEEEKRFKKLYLNLAKRLHPDLHPQQGDKEKALWLQVAQAYHAGDIEKLESLAAILTDAPGAEDVPAGKLSDAIETLQEKVRSLTRKIEAYRKRIEEMQVKFPFSIAPLLEDPALMERRKAELQDELIAYKEQAKELAAYLALMLDPGSSKAN